MSAKTLQRIRLSKRFLNAQMKRLLGVILVVMAIQIQQANAQDLFLQDTTITTTATFSANSITAGPNFTIASTGDVILSAETIAVIPRFFIIKGGKLKVVSGAHPVSVETEDPIIPDEFIVSQNYPNPFNPYTNIEYTIPKITDVELTIFNINGQKIKTLFSGKQNRGNYKIKWDGTNDNGLKVPSGTYLYILKIDNKVVSNKMIVLR